MPIFGAAYAAPNKGTTILYLFRALSTVLSPIENSRIQYDYMKDISRLLGDFPAVLFKADLIFKDFSRKPSKFKYFLSLYGVLAYLSAIGLSLNKLLYAN